jgi:predicted dehydrogenase
MSITPLILGNGRSGQAIARSLGILGLLKPELKIDAPVFLKRSDSLAEERKKYAHPVLCISNPHGLHSSAILEADQAAYDAVLCEKPACINLEQLKSLRAVKTPTAVFHVYRQMWGPQTLKQMLTEKRFGEIISIEGRYWQASTAERALHGGITKSWKNDPRLSGESDTYLDVGSHWIDAVSFLSGAVPKQIYGWRSYVNAETPHRDSHVQLTIEYPGGGRAFGSVSKTFHGATNHFEINVIGSKMSGTWEFLRPDELLLGEGRDRRVFTRKDSELGSRQPPFHGVGWLEGYIETASRLLSEVYLGVSSDFPKLTDNLDILEAMLKTQWR